MSSLFSLFFFCTILPLVLATTIAPVPVRPPKEFNVGNAEGWRQPAINETELYNQWAARRRFHVGDSLRFQYKNDSVLVVDKWGYFHCNTINPISLFNDGNTVIVLDSPGPIYFVSGDPDRCENGQRLVVEVMTLHPISPSIASPPQPYSAVSPAPSSSSGVSVCATLVSVSLALISTFVTLVLFAP